MADHLFRALCGSIVLAAAGLGACSTSATDPWAGSYAATTTTNGVDCATGASLGAPSVQSVTLVLMRDSSDHVFIAGTHCMVLFDAATNAYATVTPGQLCHSALADGTPVDASFTSGTLRLDGSHLTGSYTSHAETASQCVDATTSIDATRL